MLDFIVLQMRKVNREKGYWLSTVTEVIMHEAMAMVMNNIAFCSHESFLLKERQLGNVFLVVIHKHFC